MISVAGAGSKAGKMVKARAASGARVPHDLADPSRPAGTVGKLIGR